MGIKKIETRRWTTTYRGELLIHASKAKSGKLIAAMPSIQQFIPDFHILPFGAIIGQVILKDIVRTEQLGLGMEELQALSLEENVFGADNSSKFCWLFEKAIPFTDVIPATGRLGLWEW